MKNAYKDLRWSKMCNCDLTDLLIYSLTEGNLVDSIYMLPVVALAGFILVNNFNSTKNNCKYENPIITLHLWSFLALMNIYQISFYH